MEFYSIQPLWLGTMHWNSSTLLWMYQKYIPFYWWASFCCVTEPWTEGHLCTERHLGRSQFLEITHKATISIHIFESGIISEIQFPDSRISTENISQVLFPQKESFPPMTSTFPDHGILQVSRRGFLYILHKTFHNSQERKSWYLLFSRHLSLYKLINTDTWASL